MVYRLLLLDSPVTRRACWSHCQVCLDVSSRSSSNKEDLLDLDPFLLPDPCAPPFLNPGEGKGGVAKLILPFLLSPFEFLLNCLVIGVPLWEAFQREAAGPPRMGEGA